MDSVQIDFRPDGELFNSVKHSPWPSAQAISALYQQAEDPVEAIRQQFYTTLQLVKERRLHFVAVVESTCKSIERRINLRLHQFEQECAALMNRVGRISAEDLSHMKFEWTDNTLSIIEMLKSEFSVTGGDLYSSDSPFQQVPDWNTLINQPVSTEELELYEALLLVPGCTADSSKSFALGAAFRVANQHVKSAEQYHRSYRLAYSEGNSTRAFYCIVALGHLYHLAGLNDTALRYYWNSQVGFRDLFPESNVLTCRGLIETMLGKRRQVEAEYYYGECARQAECSPFILCDLYSKFSHYFPRSIITARICRVLTIHLKPHFQDWEKQYRLCYLDNH